MGTKPVGRKLRGAAGALALTCVLFSAGCGSRAPDFVGSWTASGDCHLTGFARIEFAPDGTAHVASRVSLMDERMAHARWHDQYGKLCAAVSDAAVPVDAKWREDGPRIDVTTTSTMWPTSIALYHRVVDGKLTIANDSGFLSSVQTYERAK
jgi:hypothetical protein